jgi:hypothetical protein
MAGPLIAAQIFTNIFLLTDGIRRKIPEIRSMLVASDGTAASCP